MENPGTTQSHHVSDIVQVLNSGIDFYSEAKEKVKDGSVAQFFDRMIAARKLTRERLQPFLRGKQGEKETGSSFAVEARKVYTKVIGSMSSDKNHTYIDQLEEVEDKTLEEIKTALDKEQPPAVETALRQSLQTMQQCHDEMRSLQKSSS